MIWKRRRRGKKAAERALQTSTRHLQQVKAREPEVQLIVNTLEAQGQRNHFIEMIYRQATGGDHAH